MITAHKAPNLVSPAFNPLAFEISSNEQARADFRYKVEVKDSGGAVLNTSYYPGGAAAADRITIDASGPLHRLQSFAAWRRDVQSGARCYYSPSFRVGYSVTISEEYSGALHGVYNSGALYTIPAGLHSIRFAFYDYPAIRTLGRWLTDFEAMQVRPDDKLTVSYLLPGTSGAVTGFDVELFARDGSSLGSATIANPSPTAADDVVHLHAGISDLSPLFAGGIDVDTLHYYTITPSNSGPALRVNAVSADCRHDGARVHFMNEWGAVDSFTFGLSVRRSSTIEKKRAKMPHNGTFLRPSIFGVGPSPFLVTYTDKLKLNSGWISDADSNALLQLFTSPIVAIDVKKNLFFPDQSGEMITIPCEVDANSYEIKTSANEKLFNIELDLNISVDNGRQKL